MLYAKKAQKVHPNQIIIIKNQVEPIINIFSQLLKVIIYILTIQSIIKYKKNKNKNVTNFEIVGNLASYSFTLSHETQIQGQRIRYIGSVRIGTTRYNLFYTFVAGYTTL